MRANIHLIDALDCKEEIDKNVAKFMLRCRDEIPLTFVGGPVHKEFSPEGLTVIAILAESHLAVHTWPEHNSLLIDFFPCHKEAPEGAIHKMEELLKEIFKPEKIITQTVTRTVRE